MDSKETSDHNAQRLTEFCSKAVGELYHWAEKES